MAGSFTFRNINTYIVEPEGEPIQSLPSKSSLDFSPQSSCFEEAPDDGKQYVRQNESWQEPDKENILGIKITDSPEFADTQIQGLKSDDNGGSVPAADYNWFKSVYASLVDGSVISWIKGLVNQVKSLATRVGVLENKTLFEITLEEDTIQIDIVGLSIKEGESFKLLIKGDSGYESTSLYVRINDIISPNYQYSSSIYSYLVIPVGNERFSNDLTMALHGGRLIGSVIYSRSASGTPAGAVVALSTFNIYIDEITKISIASNTSTIIKAGTYIKLLKL